MMGCVAPTAFTPTHKNNHVAFSSSRPYSSSPSGSDCWTDPESDAFPHREYFYAHYEY